MTAIPLMLTLLTLLPAVISAQESALPEAPADPAALLQEALYLRDTEQDLPGAMSLLREVLASQPSAEVTLQAQLQLAVCQLAAGEQEAALTGLETLLKQRMEQPAPARDDPALAQFLEGISLIEENPMNKMKRVDLLESALQGATRTFANGAEFIPWSTPDEMFQELVGVGAVLSLEGAELTVRELVEGSPAVEAGIPKKSVILRVDGKPIRDFGGKLEKMVAAIRGKEGTVVTLRCRFPGAAEEKDIPLTRRKIDLKEDVMLGAHVNAPDGSPQFLADKDAGIVSLWAGSFRPGLAKAVQEAIDANPTRGILIDLRSNGGGMLEEAVQLADLFLKEGTILCKKTGSAEPVKVTAREEGTLPKFPMVVLVDEGTASAAEVFSAALQDNGGAVITGTRTFGRGTVYSLKEVAGKGSMKLPIASLLRPDGTPLERDAGMTEADAWGVTPDVVLPPAVRPEEPYGRRDEGTIRRDAQWEAAMEHLRGMIQRR